MATAAQYASTVKSAQVQISTANSLRTGAGAIGTLIVGAASGTRIDDLTITATGTTTAGVVRLFIADPSNNVRLWQEVLVSAITPSTSVQVFSYTILNQALLLQQSWWLGAATDKAETFNVIVTRAGDF